MSACVRGCLTHGERPTATDGTCAVGRAYGPGPSIVEARIARLREVATELARAREKFAPFHSGHEGYAVILEEVEELWAEVRACKTAKPTGADVLKMRQEAVQVAAMALRFVEDVCDG